MRVRQAASLVLFILAALFPPAAHSQSMYLNRGTSGFGLGTNLMVGDGWNAFGLEAGYSVLGLVDLGFGFSRFTFDDGNLTVMALSPSISVCALRQSAESPLSIELGVAYEHDLYDSDALDLLGWDMSGSGYSLGLSVHRSIQVSPSTRAFPMVGVAYGHQSTEVEDSYGQSVSDEDDSTPLGFGLSLAFPMGGKEILYLTPRMSIVEDETSFSVSAGYILPTHGPAPEADAAPEGND